ncbi:hypothetical protein EVAR_22377_1 [Eumeta japonica]|uniref:Uncharacterized protein n=1 Tax=Eumeta variegata TaxID=151549 RepID=A0A4C1VI14_EUMVA|nr:hypothetical protein EVAR_22377_1 [Eumeta japonica]
MRVTLHGRTISSHYAWMRVAGCSTNTHTRASALRRLNERAGAGILFRREVEIDGDTTSSPTPRRRSTSFRLPNFRSGHLS